MCCAEQDQTERRTERTGCDEPVRPEHSLQFGQREGADDGTGPNRSEQYAVERRTACDLVSREEREQRPVRAREEEKRYRSNEGCEGLDCIARAESR